MIGIDEVGRGCWAGPLLVVAYRQRGSLPSAVTDSKALTRRQRQALLTAIQAAGDIGEGWVSPAEIDQNGLSTAMRLAVSRALTALNADLTETIIMDGNINYCEPHFTKVTTVIKADASHPAVSAASIHAKVRRDAYMQEQAQRYPEYGFDAHVGYGTKLHAQTLRQYGPCDLHRRSYRPVKACL